MKNSLSKIVLAAMITAAPLAASEYTFNSHSLFAVEGGATNVGTENAGVYDDKSIGNLGLKIGAQTDNYRIFLSARYYDAADASTLNTYGAELQYMFNFSEIANFFIGANGGVANVKLALEGEDSERSSETYYGGDVGFNIHATETIDIEIGARYMQLQEEVVSVATGAKVDGIATAYASVIIKWEMN